MVKIKLLIILMLLNYTAYFAQSPLDYMVGHWTFDNPDSLTAAELGSPLELIGNHTAIAGPDSNDGAVQIGVGSYYKVRHNIQPNGGGNLVNNYSIVMDVRVNQIGSWHALYQTDSTNVTDGDWFISQNGKIGIGAVGYTNETLISKQWYRIAISVSNGNKYDYYINGSKALSGTPGSIDGRFALQPVLLLFADENGEDNTIEVADVKIFSKDLSDSEIAQLGGYTVSIEDKPVVPYLQSPTPTSIYISWASKGNNPEVLYGKTQNLGNSTQATTYFFNPTTVWHTAKLEGLSPSTKYFYKVKTDSIETEIYSFRTQPLDYVNDGHIRFVILGDNRTSPDRFREIYDSLKSKLQTLYGENFVDSVNLIFNVGDIVTNGDNLSEYQNEYFQPIAPLSPYFPHMISIGNHERESSNFYNYMKFEDFGGTEGEKYYSFRIGKIKFIVVNSNTQHRNNIQINWLTQTLNDAQADGTIDWIFVFCHHPGHSELWPDGNTEYVQNRVIPVLKNYSKVDMLSYGHSHNYERGTVENGSFRLLLDGGGNSNLDRWGMYPNQHDYPEIQKTYDYNIYTIVDVDIKNKKYNAVTYTLGNPDKKLDNVVLDSFFRDKKNQALPSKPSIVTPSPDETISFPFMVNASGYNGTYEIMSSQFQVTSSEGNYDTPLINVKRDFENIYGVTDPPDLTPIDLNMGIDLTSYTITANMLSSGTNKYWVRVRYRDKNLQWSEWSDEVPFYTDNTVSINDESKKPFEYNLEVNYPNPFNPTTTIQFELPETSIVKLMVFDNLGKLVRTLIDRKIMQKGSHKIIFNASSLSSGVYYYRLEANNYIEIKKMNLIK